MNWDAYLLIELISTLFSLGFLILLMRESRWCWPFGIMGSALAVYLFVSPGAEVKLYAEAVLYSYYVWIGIYGWYRWDKGELAEKPVIVWSVKRHVLLISGATLLSPALGFLLDRYTDSNNPFLDATTTIFSFLASYMQAEKVFSSWHLWIVINGVTVWLYYTRDLYIYSGLMLVYFSLSIAGLMAWKQRLPIRDSSFQP